jgi:hypothetical protein
VILVRTLSKNVELARRQKPLLARSAAHPAGFAPVLPLLPHYRKPASRHKRQANVGFTGPGKPGLEDFQHNRTSQEMDHVLNDISTLTRESIRNLFVFLVPPLKRESRKSDDPTKD